MNDKIKNAITVSVVGILVMVLTTFAKLPNEVRANTMYREVRVKESTKEQEEKIKLAETLARIDVNLNTVMDDVKDLKGRVYDSRK